MFLDNSHHLNTSFCANKLASSLRARGILLNSVPVEDSSTFSSADALKRLYPKHSLVVTEDSLLDVLRFPGTQATPLEKSPLVTNLFFVPVARKLGIPGVLIDSVQFGIFKINWQVWMFGRPQSRTNIIFLLATWIHCSYCLCMSKESPRANPTYRHSN
jgi:hypothetical protein